MNAIEENTGAGLGLIEETPSNFVVNQQKVSQQAKDVFSKFRDLELSAYLKRVPESIKVMEVLKNKGGRIVNDHVALRSFKDQNGVSGLEKLEQVFTAFGYQKENNIQIAPLYLDCYWYEPPSDTNWPKVFISEQQVKSLPEEAQSIIFKTIGNYYLADPFKPFNLEDPANVDPKELFRALENPPWNPTFKEYNQLIEMAKNNPSFKGPLQYAAWGLVHGHRWNHFTVLLNTLGLEGIHKLEELNEFIKSNGFTLNKWGESEIQGSEEKRLKQSSTQANRVEHTFSDGATHLVPGAFVEFIERFYKEEKPFRGFIGSNARGIFASTDSLKK